MENAPSLSAGNLKTQGTEALHETMGYAEDIVSEVKSWFKSGADYVSENPKEAVVIVASLGIAAWALLATKPGRRAFEAAADRFIPEVGHWLAENFNNRVKH